MKKTTIALLTAAAMGASTAASAAEATDPSVFGRIQYTFTDQENEDFDGSLTSSHIGASGSATGLAGGLEADYYFRVGGANAEIDDNDTLETSVEYAYVNLGNELFTAQFGRNDDLVYQFVDVYLDIDREYGGAAAAVFNGADSFRLTSDFGGSPVKVGAYVNDDTTDDGDHTDGIHQTQVAASLELGMATIAAAYQDNDNTDQDTLTVGGTADLGIATVNARIRDTEAGDNPFAIGAVAPLTDNTNLILIHGDDDNDTSDNYAEVRTNLGAGLDIYGGVRRGDNATKAFVGSRLAF